MLRLVWKDVVVAAWFLVAGIPLYAVQAVGLAAAAPALLLATLFFTAALAFGPIATEEIQGTEPLWASLPVGRRDVVLARYASAAIGTVVGLGTSWAAAHLAWLWVLTDPRYATPHFGTGAYAALLAVFLFSASLFLPCYFRLGLGRGVLVFIVLSLGVIVAASILGWAAVRLSGGPEALEALRARDPRRLAEAEEWVERWGAPLAAGLVVVAGALFGASATLSTRFYSKRDL